MTDMPLGTAIAPGAAGGAGGIPDEILVAFAEPAPQNRLTVLVRIILAIPHLVVLWALGIAAEVVVIICWFAALVLGRLPEGLAGFLTGYLRWLVRVQAYLFLLTDRYPPFELGEADYPVQILLRPGPLNRLAVLLPDHPGHPGRAARRAGRARHGNDRHVRDLADRAHCGPDAQAAV